MVQETEQPEGSRIAEAAPLAGHAAPAGDDVILPAQFFAAPSDPRSEPERRLLVAVLEEAIGSLLAGIGEVTPERRAVAGEAERWFASDEHAGPFAFASICDVLDIDPTRVRETVAAWRTRRRAFRRPRLQAGPGRHQVQDAVRRARRAA